MPFIITLSVQQWIVRTVRDEIHIFDKANCILTHYAVDLSEYIYIYMYIYALTFFPSFFFPSLLSFLFILIWGLELLVLLRKKNQKHKKQNKRRTKTESSRAYQNNRFLDFCIYFYKKKIPIFLRYCDIFPFE